MDKRIKTFFAKHNIWEDKLTQLRNILLQTELEETVKWGIPAYCINNKNVIGLGAFKEHIALWFHQGALLTDEHELLINAQEGKTKAMRSIKIFLKDEISENLLLPYINQAIQNCKEGKSVAIEKPTKVSAEQLTLGLLLQENLIKHELEKNFKSLTPIQQRDYIEYINNAKRESTKLTRLEKIIPLIKRGKSISAIWSK